MTDEIERMRYDSYREWKREMDQKKMLALRQSIQFDIFALIILLLGRLLADVDPLASLYGLGASVLLILLGLELFFSYLSLNGNRRIQWLQERYKLLADYHLWQLEPEESA